MEETGSKRRIPVDIKGTARRLVRRRLVLWPAVALVAYSILGFFVLPPVLRSVLTKKLSETLHRSVSIRAIRINPFVLSARVEGFSVKDREGTGPFFSFEEIYLNLQAASILRGGPVLREILLRAPSATLVRNEDSTYNFSDLLGGEDSGPAEEKKPYRYSLNNIRIVGGSIDFDDRPRHTRHTVRDLSIAIPFLSNLPQAVDIFVQPSFAATINGTETSLSGRTKPYSPTRETVVDFAIRDFEIPHYLEYLPVKRRFRVPSGRLDATTVFSFSQPPGGSPAVFVSGTVSIADLAVTDAKGSPALRIPSLSVEIGLLDPLGKRATLDNVVVSSPELTLVRGNDGALNLAAMLPKGTGDAATKTTRARRPPGETSPSKAWEVEVKRATLKGGSVTAVDRTPDDPFTGRISGLEIVAEGLSTEKDRRGKVSLQAVVNRSGSVGADCSLGITPLSAEVDLTARKIGLVPFQPYLAEILRVTLTGGNASARGKLSVAARGDAIRTTYTGNLLVSNLASVDRVSSEDFLKWGALHLDGIRLETAPLSLAIREVSLSDFYSRLIVNRDGTLNVQQIVRKEEEAPAAGSTGAASDNVAETKPTEPSGAPTPVSIRSVTLQGGRINFTDHFIQPNYSANFLQVGGRISGMTSEESETADVDLRGKLENYAPLEITGTINPLRKDLFVDLKADFKDMDLSPLTPYSGRYAGYTIQKGKLSLHLEYRIAKRKLEAENNVFLDQFTFGEPVESPDATKLPVRLAVALLKDRNGEIRLDLPVSGSLDDPQFRVGQVVLKILVNLLIKAATSPFALLGALFGGGEELSYLEFDYGREMLDGPGEAKVASLAKALHERPSLKLEIAGHVDPEKDREALRQIRFDRKVRAQKLKDLARSEREGLSLDNVVVDPKEYPVYLKRAYRAEKFPKPRNFLGMVKDIPVPEMEKLMFANIRVTDDDLRLLAQRRAQAVKDSLIATKQVEPERIFLVEPKELPPEKKEHERDSRVEFVLR